MKKYTVFLVMALLLSMMGTAGAYPSFWGPTGAIATPTAQTLGLASFSVGFYNAELKDVEYEFLGANLGLTPDLEIGAGRVEPERGDEESILNAKYRLIPETAATIALAVGVADVTDEFDATPYVVATKHLGDTQFNVGFAGGDERLDGVFASIIHPLRDNLAVVFEYDTEDVNAGVNLKLLPGLRLHGGLTNMEDVYFGISYTH